MTVSVPTFAISTQVVTHDRVAVPILHPADDKTPTGLVIVLAGRLTKQHRAAQAALRAASMHEDGDDQESRETRMREFTLDLVVGWEGVQDAEGAALPFARATCAALFAAEEWIYHQVAVATGERERFFGFRSTD